MEKLDLNAYGMEELTEMEQQTVDGGMITIIRVTFDPLHVYVLGMKVC